MHRQAKWAMPVDTFILQFLEETRFKGQNIIAPPKTIARHIRYSRKHVADRCLVLHSHKLIRRVDCNAEYQITDDGTTALTRPVDYFGSPNTDS